MEYDADAPAGLPTDLETLTSIAARQLDLALDSNNPAGLWNAAYSRAASAIVTNRLLERIAGALERQLKLAGMRGPE